MTDEPETTEQDRADADAARVLAPHLAGRLAPTLEPHRVAGLLVGVLREHGWRPIPRPPQVAADARPGDYARGAALAREELAKTRTETEGDHRP